MGQGMMVVPATSIKIPDMKPNNVFSGILGLLLLASATIHASPDEEQTPSKSGLRIITEPVLTEAAVSLVNTYNQSGPYETILLENAESGRLTGMIREAGTMALVTGYSPALSEQPDLWRMAVGKQVIIPVMYGRNPEYEAITIHGITLESLISKASGPEGLLMIRGAGVETMVAGFLGVEQSEMQATLLQGTGELLRALEKNPGSIAFARLTDVMELQSLQLAEGLHLVPLDLDGNGTLSPLEDIYRSPSDLVHAIQIGKYPRMLSSKIYVVASQPPQEENQVAFLDWMVKEGQEQLALAGIMQMTSFENQSALRSLHRPAAPVTGAPMAAPATRVILWITLSLLVILALVITIIQRISLRTALPAEVKDARPSFGQNNLSFPGGLFFDRTHTWTFMEKDGKVRIGMDDFLLHVAGPVTRVELKKPGATV